MKSRMKLVGPLLIALVVLVGGGYYNYQRNAPLDRELQNRPHAGLSTSDLELLFEAHKAELARLERKLGVQSDGTREVGSYAPSDLKGKLQGFDRFQSRNRLWKEVYREKLDQELAIESIDKERALRHQGLDQRWVQIWRRVSTL